MADIVDRMGMDLATYDKFINELEGDAFEQHLAEMCGLTDHPKREDIFTKAWRDQHSDGLWFVVMAYEELAELIL